jgi:hypothetical protein
MSDADLQKNTEEDVETALLDADLFLKYKAPHRAIKRLQSAVERHPRSVGLREKLREIASANKQPDEAARQCLALANLYIAREDFEAAHERLLEAKQLDPRISIASGLEAIRHARRPGLAQHVMVEPRDERIPILAGDLSAVSIFDAVQVLENSRLTGALTITSSERQGRVLFNEGRIVGAESGGTSALDAFRLIVEVASGKFEFEKSAQEYPVTINAASNTNLLLDTLRQLDEEKM